MTRRPAEKLTFWRWLGRQTKRDDRVGDLARDALRDPCWPRRARSIRTMHLYLESQGAIPGVFRALGQAFDEWQTIRRGAVGHDAQTR